MNFNEKFETWKLNFLARNKCELVKTDLQRFMPQRNDSYKLDKVGYRVKKTDSIKPELISENMFTILALYEIKNSSELNNAKIREQVTTFGKDFLNENENRIGPNEDNLMLNYEYYLNDYKDKSDWTPKIKSGFFGIFKKQINETNLRNKEKKYYLAIFDKGNDISKNFKNYADQLSRVHNGFTSTATKPINNWSSLFQTKEYKNLKDLSIRNCNSLAMEIANSLGLKINSKVDFKSIEGKEIAEPTKMTIYNDIYDIDDENFLITNGCTLAEKKTDAVLIPVSMFNGIKSLHTFAKENTLLPMGVNLNQNLNIELKDYKNFIDQTIDWKDKINRIYHQKIIKGYNENDLKVFENESKGDFHPVKFFII